MNVFLPTVGGKTVGGKTVKNEATKSKTIRNKKNYYDIQSYKYIFNYMIVKRLPTRSKHPLIWKNDIFHAVRNKRYDILKKYSKSTTLSVSVLYCVENIKFEKADFHHRDLIVEAFLGSNLPVLRYIFDRHGYGQRKNCYCPTNYPIIKYCLDSYPDINLFNPIEED